ncbi:uncharacterized protein MICPUCDRAFT_66396 [Micromonas pusilla CCMP1545]|uniref:Predicted protein n=1 Tax=Micromonas pusilla (strain CCMP1545) TaxID=564608 RepID=C1N8H8_MICPC|nr:uncharacterized protein MICPUCDRAFT_66396 [Micromonas pusilla CCMP1545]EEH51891.1 predicted protein [Micromonas pusilla CCMP1545]|eukprot:XP_003064269.1 predicted protein [Micromonas pusilla CCMP1545]
MTRLVLGPPTPPPPPTETETETLLGGGSGGGSESVTLTPPDSITGRLRAAAAAAAEEDPPDPTFPAGSLKASSSLVSYSGVLGVTHHAVGAGRRGRSRRGGGAGGGGGSVSSRNDARRANGSVWEPVSPADVERGGDGAEERLLDAADDRDSS